MEEKSYRKFVAKFRVSHKSYLKDKEWVTETITHDDVTEIMNYIRFITLINIHPRDAKIEIAPGLYSSKYFKIFLESEDQVKTCRRLVENDQLTLWLDRKQCKVRVHYKCVHPFDIFYKVERETKTRREQFRKEPKMYISFFYRNLPTGGYTEDNLASIEDALYDFCDGNMLPQLQFDKDKQIKIRICISVCHRDRIIEKIKTDPLLVRMGEYSNIPQYARGPTPIALGPNPKRTSVKDMLDTIEWKPRVQCYANIDDETWQKLQDKYDERLLDKFILDAGQASQHALETSIAKWIELEKKSHPGFEVEDYEEQLVNEDYSSILDTFARSFEQAQTFHTEQAKKLIEALSVIISNFKEQFLQDLREEIDCEDGKYKKLLEEVVNSLIKNN